MERGVAPYLNRCLSHRPALILVILDFCGKCPLYPLGDVLLFLRTTMFCLPSNLKRKQQCTVLFTTHVKIKSSVIR